MYGFYRSPESRVYERKVPNLIDTLATVGGFIDILSLIAGMLYTFFGGPANELYQAASFAKIMKVRDFPKVNIISNTIYWF